MSANAVLIRLPSRPPCGLRPWKDWAWPPTSSRAVEEDRELLRSQPVCAPRRPWALQGHGSDLGLAEDLVELRAGRVARSKAAYLRIACGSRRTMSRSNWPRSSWTRPLPASAGCRRCGACSAPLAPRTPRSSRQDTTGHHLPATDRSRPSRLRRRWRTSLLRRWRSRPGRRAAATRGCTPGPCAPTAIPRPALPGERRPTPPASTAGGTRPVARSPRCRPPPASRSARLCRQPGLLPLPSSCLRDAMPATRMNSARDSRRPYHSRGDRVVPADQAQQLLVCASSSGGRRSECSSAPPGARLGCGSPAVSPATSPDDPRRSGGPRPGSRTRGESRRTTGRTPIAGRRASPREPVSSRRCRRLVKASSPMSSRTLRKISSVSWCWRKYWALDSGLTASDPNRNRSGCDSTSLTNRSTVFCPRPPAAGG